jgi:glycosyltransferase involved in cell wall biosynthesis
MRVFHVLPGRHDFAVNGATSVELCVADWVGQSRFRDSTTIVAEQGDSPLLPISIVRTPPIYQFVSWRLAYAVRRAARRKGCDLIVCQQHVATAARIAALSPDIPVVLQTHNFIAPPRRGALAGIANALVRRRLARLGGLTLISEATRADFEEKWPTIVIPREVVTNGFTFPDWSPSAARRQTVIVVGRTEEDKGLLEAAIGTVRFLAQRPDWDAVFVLSEPERNPAYFCRVEAALAPAGARAQLLTCIPFQSVKELNEVAAIAVVASKWREPFGRTALEAHAGGAALISSGAGGLREISGDCAAYLDQVTGEAIAEALSALAADETRRARLARDGAERVRRLFSLASSPDGASDAVIPVSERLDAFCERVVSEWRKAKPRRGEERT